MTTDDLRISQFTLMLRSAGPVPPLLGHVEGRRGGGRLAR